MSDEEKTNDELHTERLQLFWMLNSTIGKPPLVRTVDDEQKVWARIVEIRKVLKKRRGINK